MLHFQAHNGRQQRSEAFSLQSGGAGADRPRATLILLNTVTGGEKKVNHRLSTEVDITMARCVTVRVVRMSFVS
jgi:hypothetical protein